MKCLSSSRNYCGRHGCSQRVISEWNTSLVGCLRHHLREEIRRARGTGRNGEDRHEMGGRIGRDGFGVSEEGNSIVEELLKVSRREEDKKLWKGENSDKED